MNEHRYYAYIVASRSHTLYVGFTGQIEVRMRRHKAGTFEGFSKAYHCSRLVLLERYPEVQEAIAREKQLKGWTRLKKIALIEKLNPAWVDLSEAWGKPVQLYSQPTPSASRTAGPSTAPLRGSAQDDILE